MTRLQISRRVFLAAAGAAGASLLVACGGSGGTAPGDPGTGSGFVAFRLSTKGKRASNAAKKNAANKLFATAAAADAGRAHAGDGASIVTIDISEARWIELFGGRRDTVDLRTL